MILCVACFGVNVCTVYSWGRESYLSAVFTCNYVVSVRRGFLFLRVLGMG